MAILGLLYFLVRIKWELSFALAACAVATGILFGVHPGTFLTTVFHTTFSDKTILNTDTWMVLFLVIFILVLSRCLKVSGALDQLVGSVRKVLGDNRFTIAALPALIGLLPLPGGALISAPMIEDLADEAEVSLDNRTYLNYWFRHVWEYSYPLYPGLILASVVIGIKLSDLIIYQFPLSLAAILGGSLFGLMGIQKHFRKRLVGEELMEAGREFLSGFWPVLLIFVALLVFKLPFLLVVAVVVPLFGIQRLGIRTFLFEAKTAMNYKILGTIYAVLVFKDIINVSGAVDQLSGVFNSWGVPPIVLFMVLPAVIGYLNGITHAYVSVAFPLLLPFFMGVNGEVDLSRVQLAYTFGFIGVIYSPVHLCLVLSCEYYKANINNVFKKMILPTMILALVSLAMYFAGSG